MSQKKSEESNQLENAQVIKSRKSSKQFVKGKGFLVCDVRVAAHTQNCPKMVH